MDYLQHDSIGRLGKVTIGLDGSLGQPLVHESIDIQIAKIRVTSLDLLPLDIHAEIKHLEGHLEALSAALSFVLAHGVKISDSRRCVIKTRSFVAGCAVATAGDVNGDDYSDILVTKSVVYGGE
jgi:hypothetical protein